VTTFAEARNRARTEPVILVEIELLNSGPTLYLSDRNVTVGGRHYQDYLESLGSLGEELRRQDSSSLNTDASLRFRNDPYGGYAHLVEMEAAHPFTGAAVTVRECYLDEDGTPSDTETIFRGVLDEPREIDLLGFTCRISTMEHKADRQWKQARVDLATYPNAYEDVDKLIPFVYGDAGRVPARRTDWGAKTTLAVDLTDSQTAGIELSDASRMPSTGSVWIDEEKISYTGIASNVLGGVTRGAGGTTARPHGRGAVVWEDRANYDSVLADHELHTVGDIFAEISGTLFRVASGVSAQLLSGRHILRATQQVRVLPLMDEGSHSHAQSPSTDILRPTGAESSDSGNGETFAWSGNNNNIYDESTTTSRKVTCTPFLYDSWARIQATFDTYAGPDPKTVKAKIIHRSSLSVTPQDTKNYVRLYYDDTNYLQLDHSGGKQTQTFVIPGAVVPGFLRYQIGASDNPSGSFSGEVFEIWLEVEAESTSSDPASGIGATGGTVSVAVVDRFHAAVKGYKDTTGDYGGVGTLIERPDHVLKHFLVNRLGFPIGEIGTSFATAGASYATEGYTFAFAVFRPVKPSEFVRELAFQCRSVAKYRAGTWKLDFLPDAAPAAVKAISREALAGEKERFVFHHTRAVDIANDLTARHEQNYSRLGSESEWNATAGASDSSSIARYGSYPREFTFPAIRDAAMASDVLSHILMERKAPLLVAEFPVFSEHFDLGLGDTVEIDNPLFGGKRFFIERIERDGKHRALVRALEWWG
jgi:hypothetical protein